MSHKLYFALIPSVAAVCTVKGDDKATEKAQKQLLNAVHSALGVYAEKFEAVDPAKGKSKRESDNYAKLKLGKDGVSGTDKRQFALDKTALTVGSNRPLELYQFTRDSLVFVEDAEKLAKQHGTPDTDWIQYPSVPARLAEWIRVASGLVHNSPPDASEASGRGEASTQQSKSAPVSA